MQHSLMAAVETCRTAALGGPIEGCEDCGHRRIAYNSCLMGKVDNGESKAALPIPCRFSLGSALHNCDIPEQGDQLVRP